MMREVRTASQLGRIATVAGVLARTPGADADDEGEGESRSPSRPRTTSVDLVWPEMWISDPLGLCNCGVFLAAAGGSDRRG